MSPKQSQIERVKAHLEKGNKLTPLEALNKFGCLRLSGVIFDLKKRGMNIETNLIEVSSADGVKRVAEYGMVTQ